MSRLVLAGLVAVPLTVAALFGVLVARAGQLLEVIEDALTWEDFA